MPKSRQKQNQQISQQEVNQKSKTLQKREFRIRSILERNLDTTENEIKIQLGFNQNSKLSNELLAAIKEIRQDLLQAQEIKQQTTSPSTDVTNPTSTFIPLAPTDPEPTAQEPESTDSDPTDDESLSIKELLVSALILTGIGFSVLYMSVPSFAAEVTLFLASTQVAFAAAASAILMGLQTIGAALLGLFGATLSAGASAAIGGAVIFSGLAVAALLIGAIAAVTMKIVNSIAQAKAEHTTERTDLETEFTTGLDTIVAQAQIEKELVIQRAASATRIQSAYRAFQARAQVAELRNTPNRREDFVLDKEAQEQIIARLVIRAERTERHAANQALADQAPEFDIFAANTPKL
jgi:hypothetical protein